MQGQNVGNYERENRFLELKTYSELFYSLSAIFSTGGFTGKELVINL